MKRELKIGIFMAGTFVILAVFIFIVGDMSELVSRSRGYELYRPHSTPPWGWRSSAAVKMAGVKIGYVKDIRLDERRGPGGDGHLARHSRSPKGPRRRCPLSASLGEKYIEIIPSEEADFLRPGRRSRRAEPSASTRSGRWSFRSVMSSRQLSRSLREMTGRGHAGTDFRETLEQPVRLHRGNSTSSWPPNKDEPRDRHPGTSPGRHGTSTSKLARDRPRNLDETIGDQWRSLVERTGRAVKTNLEKIKEVLDRARGVRPAC